jgi:hypothetical protein
MTGMKTRIGIVAGSKRLSIRRSGGNDKMLGKRAIGHRANFVSHSSSSAD